VRLLTGASFASVANLSAPSARLVIQDTQTLTGNTINLDGTSVQLAIDGSNTVTLGVGTLVRGRGTIGNAIFVGGTAGLNNQGTIRADLAGQTLNISPTNFTNEAAGIVEAINGSNLTISATNWTNAGQINATGSAAVNLTGTYTTPGIVNTSTGGVVNLQGTWNNPGNYTFPGTGSLTLLGGNISGGQITPTGGKTLLYSGSGGILSNGLVFSGDLNLSDASDRLRLQSGASFTGVANVSGNSAVLGFEYSGTLTGKTINLDGANPQFSLEASHILTLGPGTLVRGRGTVGNQVFIGGTNTLINQGTIRADLTGQTLTVSPNGFSQQGAVEALNGGTLSIPAGYIQTAGTTRVDGTIQTSAGSSIVIVSGSLEGKGTVNANVTNSGTISPGLSAGALSIVDDLSLTSSSIIRIELGGTTQGTQYDLLSEAGTIPLTLAGTLSVSFLNGFESTVQASDTFTIIASNQAITGAFTNLVGGRIEADDSFGNLAGTFALNLAGNNVTLGSWIPVPEPATGALGLLGLPLLMLRVRRQRHGLSERSRAA
jgi:autotransporter family porin